jgi:hypothetical protein
MRPAKSKPYRRSWKNLLLNKRYQLGFTLFMVGLSALLMAFLGYWVLREARRATEVAVNNVEGQRCPPVPELGATERNRVIIDEITNIQTPPGEAPAGEAPEAQPQGEAATAGTATTGAAEADEVAKPADEAAKPADEAAKPADEAEPTGAGEAAPAAGVAPAGTQPEGAEGERARPEVTLDEGTVVLDLPPSVPPDFVEAVIQHYRCHHERVSKMAALHTGYRRIVGVLIGVGAILILGLSFWGIKMTHRLAGPLYKVELYFEKMRSGRFDEVYDLRKGDQLVEFYEQFKAAHGGLRAMQEKDIAHLRAVIEVAEASELAARSPEIVAMLAEMRETLARKEKSIE